MYYSYQRRTTLSKGIFLMWSNWAISVGLICLLIALAPLFHPKIVPALALLLEVSLISINHKRRLQETPSCFRIGYIAEVVLLFAAIFLIAVYVYIWVLKRAELTGQAANPDSPQIPVLITAPLATIISAYYIIRGTNSTYCLNCMRNQGDNADPGYLGRIFSKESEYQLRLFGIMSMFVSVVAWGYYFTYYINVNLSRSDYYFFIFLPLSIYVISLFFFGVRYFNMWKFYCNNASTARMLAKGGTTVRYLIICDDKLLLNAPSPDAEVITTDDMRIDIPLRISVSYTEKISQYEADEYFRNATGITDAEIKLVFESRDPGMYQNIFHYAAYITRSDSDAMSETVGGEWFNIHETNKMIRSGIVSSQLSRELHRIYTVAMAWKTYDAKGRRLYPIKHYRPTFRLKDLHKWNVDFNDPNWIFVSNVNQDKCFFRLRRLWNRLMTGNAK